MSPRKKKAKPKLCVTFDTNVLYNQIAHELVRSEVRDLIRRNSNHADIDIHWHIPRLVVDERRHQMQKRAFESIPAIEKLERLLGHNLNITREILTERVNFAIDRQLGELGLEVIDLDTSKVAWEQIIDRSVRRLPPFAPGENEKGFRDILIAEAFLQLVERSPNSPSVCRLAIVTDDSLLSDFISELTSTLKNVRVLKDIDELGSLINTLVSEVTEEFVENLKEKAKTCFFEKDNPNSLWYKDNLYGRITRDFHEQLAAKPEATLSRRNKGWIVGDVVFVKKHRQRTFWMTPIDVKAKLSALENRTPALTTGLGMAVSGLNEPQLSASGLNYLTGLTPAMPEWVEKSGGTTRFEVHWSANLTQAGKFTSARVDQIIFVSTKWDVD